MSLLDIFRPIRPEPSQAKYLGKCSMHDVARDPYDNGEVAVYAVRVKQPSELDDDACDGDGCSESGPYLPMQLEEIPIWQGSFANKNLYQMSVESIAKSAPAFLPIKGDAEGYIAIVIEASCRSGACCQQDCGPLDWGIAEGREGDTWVSSFIEKGQGPNGDGSSLEFILCIESNSPYDVNGKYSSEHSEGLPHALLFEDVVPAINFLVRETPVQQNDATVPAYEPITVEPIVIEVGNPEPEWDDLESESVDPEFEEAALGFEVIDLDDATGSDELQPDSF